MTVAHLRSTVIGHALAKMYDAAGYATVRINHLGDWGVQFGKILSQYFYELGKRGQEFLDELVADPPRVLLKIYQDFCKKEP